MKPTSPGRSDSPSRSRDRAGPRAVVANGKDGMEAFVRDPGTPAPMFSGALDLQVALAEGTRNLDLAIQQISRLQQEIAQLSASSAKARDDAYHDELTGLPNRRLFVDRFHQAVARGSRHHKRMALLFLDLDGFKVINDSLGHDMGDKLLQQVAGRLLGCIRASDTVCRYGGDEFLVLLVEIDGLKSAMAVAAKVRSHIAKAYSLPGTVVHLTTSVGVAMQPAEGGGVADLIRRSDVAMYFDKARSAMRTAPESGNGRPVLTGWIDLETQGSRSGPLDAKP